jgi:hypothetical protein
MMEAERYDIGNLLTKGAELSAEKEVKHTRHTKQLMHGREQYI